VRPLIVIGFWLLVFALARLFWRFATRPQSSKEQAPVIIRAADSLSRGTAKAMAYALWALLAAMGAWALIVIGIASD
jgi:cytochrome b561